MMNTTIIGGGITGLATALAFSKKGLPYQVFEKFPALNEVGAGIWMQPNAMKVLDWLGIKDSIMDAGAIISNVELTNQLLHPIRKTGLNLASQDASNQIISIHRARLQKILYEAIDQTLIHLDQPYHHHKVTDNSVIVKTSQQSFSTDLLFGADGIQSAVRKQLFPTSKTRYSGQTCWRGIAQFDMPDSFKNRGIEAWGPGKRFGFSSISKTEVYWFAVAKARFGAKDERSDVKDKLKTLFQSFHSMIIDIIQETSLDNIIRNDLSDLSHLRSWYDDRICLLGDAAHATTPNMGQGAAQGIEDAYYISHFLSQEQNYLTTFRKFQKIRRKKVNMVVNTSWWMGQMAHNPWGQFIAKLAIKYMPEKIIQKQSRSLYNVHSLDDTTFIG